jgi:hypothetical protein
LDKRRLNMDMTPTLPHINPPVIILTSICRIDVNRVYLETSKQDIKLLIPTGWVACEPPLGEGIWQFTTAGWVQLEAYPEAEPIAHKTIYQRTEFIDVIDNAGLSNELGALLSQAPLIIREQWYANPTIDITDPRVVGFFQQANISLDDIFK